MYGDTIVLLCNTIWVAQTGTASSALATFRDYVRCSLETCVNLAEFALLLPERLDKNVRPAVSRFQTS